MKASLLFILICNLLNASVYEQGKDLYYQNGCNNCHGTEAEGSSYYPRLANKKEGYLIEKLEAFKKGEAKSQKAEIMFTFAKGLNEKEIAAIASFLSTFEKDTSDKYEISDDILGSVD
ncbi:MULTISPECIES: c-type cytochrome [Sulfurimonas]|uniref:c-type cytochrome n=1 Tax=Sulfurimonas TaxID=202746 RepID=UPI001264861D|nr:c-type cytochrome [Sulfurimonas indica]